jgi:hypothetical protein
MLGRTMLAGGLALAATSFVLAQELTRPPLPEDALSPRELIAWSNLQAPQPAQNPLPPIQTQAREPNQDSAQRPQQPQGAQAQQRQEQAHDTPQSSKRDSRTRKQ